jgi:hypothetical protein
MVTEPTTPPFFGTQARILISEWKALAKLIISHSIPAKEKPILNIEDLESFDIENLENINFGIADELPHIMAEKNIQTALQGPFGGMIRDKMAAYARLTRVRLEIHLSKEELFKNKRAKPEAERIPEKKLEKLNFSLLDEMQHQLDELTEQHNEQWREFIQHWTEMLIDFFAESKLLLTEREVKELQDEDVTTDLLPRFIEVGLKLPQKDYKQMNCADYLYLKMLLTTQSALSRQHLAHDDAQIQQKLQGFKSQLTKMQKEEQTILEEQKKQSTAVLSAVDL